MKNDHENKFASWSFPKLELLANGLSIGIISLIMVSIFLGKYYLICVLTIIGVLSFIFGTIIGSVSYEYNKLTQTLFWKNIFRRTDEEADDLVKTLYYGLKASIIITKIIGCLMVATSLFLLFIPWEF